jgi:hypothetical protein
VWRRSDPASAPSAAPGAVVPPRCATAPNNAASALRFLSVILAITIPLIPRCARVLRSSALSIREVPYIDTARACGFGHSRHIVPNAMAPFLILLTPFVGQAILAEASLSYLGLGVQEPVPAWGLMLQGRRRGIRLDPAVDCRLPGARYCADCIRLQPVRRRLTRRPRPQAARSLTRLCPSPQPSPRKRGEGISPRGSGCAIRGENDPRFRRVVPGHRPSRNDDHAL